MREPRHRPWKDGMWPPDSVDHPSILPTVTAPSMQEAETATAKGRNWFVGEDGGEDVEQRLVLAVN